MEKTQNDFPKVWVVTGTPEYTTDPVVITVCPDLDSALKAKSYYGSYYGGNYDDIECREFSQETFEEIPTFYEGNFSAELRPFGTEPETYIFGNLNFMSYKRYIQENETPEQHNDFSFYINKTISDTNKVTTKISGTFENPTQFSFYLKEVPSVERARREWLMEKINAKGLVKIVMPDFEV